MRGIVVDINEAPKEESIFNVVLFNRKRNANGIETDWAFKRVRYTNNQLAFGIKNGKIELLNGKLKGNKVVGKFASFDRFKQNQKPLVILSEIRVKNGNSSRVIGYKVATHTGAVKNVLTKKLIQNCEGKKVPIQNAQYVSNGKFIRCYAEDKFLVEYKAVKKSDKAVKPVIDEEKSKKAISKMEEIFTKEQIVELKKGKQAGVNIRVYGNPKIEAEKMAILREMLEKGLNAQAVADPRYSVDALEMLLADMEAGIDVTYYCSPEYDLEQLFQLSLAYENGVDISKLADPKNSASEMSEIRIRLEADLWAEHEVQEGIGEF